jgi:TonB family protein
MLLIAVSWIKVPRPLPILQAVPIELVEVSLTSSGTALSHPPATKPFTPPKRAHQVLRSTRKSPPPFPISQPSPAAVARLDPLLEKEDPARRTEGKRHEDAGLVEATEAGGHSDVPAAPGPASEAGSVARESSPAGHGASLSVGGGKAPLTGIGTWGKGISKPTRPAGGYQVKPRYPESARKEGVQGTTELKVLVRADGSVGQVLVAKSAGHLDLDRAAVDAVRTWRFAPARREREAVAVWVVVPVEFRLE